MSLTDWASQVARDKLESLPSRWAHVQGVARQARTLRAIAGQDADLLEAAAVLHDVGYGPDIAVTGFYPLDGRCIWPMSEHRSDWCIWSLSSFSAGA